VPALRGGGGRLTGRDELTSGVDVDGSPPEAEQKPGAQRRSGASRSSARRWILLLAISASVIVADQGTKYWAVANLTHVFERAGAETAGEKVDAFLGKRKLERMRTRPVVVHPEFFQLRYVENPGAAWGMLSSLHDEVRIPFFYVVSILAIGIITVIFSRIRREQRLLQVIFALILGGAIGNFIDRVARGYVIDFIDWHWKHQGHFPTFNVADVAISLGLGGLILEGLLGRRRLAPGGDAADAAPAGVPALGVATAAQHAGEGELPELGETSKTGAGGGAPHSALSPGTEASEHGEAAGPKEPASDPSAASATEAAGAAPCTPTSSPGSSRLPS